MIEENDARNGNNASSFILRMNWGLKNPYLVI